MTDPSDFGSLDDRLRQARPDLPRRGEPLSDAEQKVLSNILASPPVMADRQGRRWSRRPTFWLVAASVLVAVALAVTGLNLVQPARAYAATPPPLTVAPVELSASDVLNAAADELRPLSEPASTHAFHTWALASEADESGHLSSFVQPMVATASISEDGTTTTMRWTAGESSPADAPGAARPGTEVAAYPPADFPVMFADPPVEPAAWGPYLTRTAFLSEHPTTGDYLLGIQSLLVERELSSAQESSLLRFLATLPDLSVEGAVEDRLGRAGVAVSTTDRMPGEFIDLLVVSTNGEGILSAEMTYMGKDRTDIQAPAVVLYYAWER